MQLLMEKSQMTGRPDPEPRERNVELDFVRGILIILMVYGHSGYVGSLRELLTYASDWIYSFHMPIFFLISGYFFHDTLNKQVDFVRFFRTLVVPYLVFETVYLIALTVAQLIGVSTTNTPPTSVMDLLATIMFRPIGAFWFLYTIIAFQLVLLASKYLLRNVEKRRDLYWVPALVVLAAACSAGILREWAMTYLFLGWLFAAAGLRIRGFLVFGMVGAAVSIALSGLVPIPFSILQIAWCVSLIGVFGGLCGRSPGFFRSLFVWIGKNTLIVLLLHALFVVGLKPFVAMSLWFDPSGVTYSVLITTITVAMCLTLSLITDWLGQSPLLFGKQRIYVPRSS